MTTAVQPEPREQLGWLYTPEFRACVRGALSMAKRSISTTEKAVEPAIAPTNVAPFGKRGSASIEPELKQFLDESVIPILIRQALQEKSLESMVLRTPHSVSVRAGIR
jgi:hypothetical protein